MTRRELVRPPSRALAAFVAEVRTITDAAPGAAQRIELLPDGTSALVCRDHGPTADLGVTGPKTAAHYKHAPSLPRFVQLVFRPGGLAPFVGTPVSELADRVVPLDELWRGADRVLDDMKRARTAEDSARVVEAALERRLARSPSADTPALALARRAARLIGERGRRIPALADDLAISERHLRRLFRDAVGLTPKAFARIVRVRRAFADAQGRSWSEIAHVHGFFDQSHLVAEAKALLHMSPAAFARRAEAPAPAIECRMA